ncbi:arsenic resistance protein [Caloranaerobacter azorensis]|nr:bile acid:sodium symporter [Caloranaerobacter azorensis]
MPITIGGDDIMKVLDYVKSKLPYFILAMMILGLINGYLNDVGYLKKLVTPTLFLMIYPMMINLKVTDLFNGFKNPKPLILSVVINFLISPIIAFGLSKVFFKNSPMLMVGLILISLIPTSGMTASWTGLANGNMKTALVMISGNLLLSILMIPLYMKLFLGEVVTINTISIINSLLKVVIIPLILGDLTRRLIIKISGEKRYRELKPNFGSISSLGVLFIVFIAMSLKSKTIISKSELVLYSLIPLVIYYAVLLLISHVVGEKILDKKNRISLVYGTTMRNLTVALGLSLAAFGGSLAVFLIAIGYIIQVPLAAFYMQLVKKQALN